MIDESKFVFIPSVVIVKPLARAQASADKDLTSKELTEAEAAELVKASFVAKATEKGAAS